MPYRGHSLRPFTDFHTLQLRLTVAISPVLRLPRFGSCQKGSREFVCAAGKAGTLSLLSSGWTMSEATRS